MQVNLRPLPGSLRLVLYALLKQINIILAQNNFASLIYDI